MAKKKTSSKKAFTKKELESIRKKLVERKAVWKGEAAEAWR